MKASEVIEGVIKLFGNGEGWSNKSLWESHNKYCLLGGLRKVAEGHPYGVGENKCSVYLLDNEHEAVGIVHKLVRESTNYKSIPSFNDRNKEGFPAVKRLLCKAMKAALDTEAERDLTDDQ